MNETFDKPEAGDKQDDSESYKKQLMDELDKKVEEKSKFYNYIVC